MGSILGRFWHQNRFWTMSFFKLFFSRRLGCFLLQKVIKKYTFWSKSEQNLLRAVSSTEKVQTLKIELSRGSVVKNHKADPVKKQIKYTKLSFLAEKVDRTPRAANTLICLRFWCHFWEPLGSQNQSKIVKKSIQKRDENLDEKSSPLAPKPDGRENGKQLCKFYGDSITENLRNMKCRKVSNAMIATLHMA